LYRLRGEWLLLQGLEADAETSFYQAIQVARDQEAKSWEVRAASSLAQLWQRQGKQQEAQELLEPIYDWFTEGFETSDLRHARKLLKNARNPG
jgi:predicted ATPase